MANQGLGVHEAFLSTLPAQAGDRKLAFAVAVTSLAIFLAVAPFAKQPLPAAPAFLPAYQSALVLVEVITAVLLFGQFAILRVRALLVLASGYLFSAFMAMGHAISFPGLFAPAGTLGVGPQTTAWLYFLWHAGFPLFLMAYAILKTERRAAARTPGSAAVAVVSSVGAVFVACGGLFFLTTAGHAALPVIMQGNIDAPAKAVVATSTWGVSFLALLVLWWRRPHALLDLWLMVVMCAWIFDIALAAVLNQGRYDVGWYGGRVYGLLAASFVLVVLLLENGRLYASLARAHGGHVKRLQLLHEIDRAVAAREQPEAIAAAVIEPLRDVLDVPRAIVNIFDLAAGEAEWLAAAGRRRKRSGGGVRFSLRLMGDVEALKRGEPQVIDTHALPAGPDKEALLGSGVERYMAVPMIAGGELIGAISFGGAHPSFPVERVNIAREVATQLAIAVSQARLYERVQRHAEVLEQRVRERTAELESANKDLESFSYSVSHDLRAPLRAVDGYAFILEENYGTRLDEEGRRLLGVVRKASRKMDELIEDLLAFSRLGRQELSRRSVDMTALAREVVTSLHDGPGAAVELATLPAAKGDPALLRQVWTNLISNALKYSGKREGASVEIGGSELAGENVYWVRDNGVGFDMQYASKLFGVFQRLHSADEFPGTGVGLAIVQRVIVRHGGRVWAESRLGEGATFHFSLPSAAA